MGADAEPRAADLAGMAPREIDRRIVDLQRQHVRAGIEVVRTRRNCLPDAPERANAEAAEQNVRDTLALLVAEYQRRQGTRFYLPTRGSARGHIDRGCRMIRKDTSVSMLWQCSGMAAEEVLELLGPVFCVQCYPGDLGPRRGITRRHAEELTGEEVTATRAVHEIARDQGRDVRYT